MFVISAFILATCDSTSNSGRFGDIKFSLSKRMTGIPCCSGTVHGFQIASSKTIPKSSTRVGGRGNSFVLLNLKSL